MGSALSGGGRLVSVLSALVGWRLVGRRLLRAGLLRARLLGASLARGRRSVAALIALLLVGRRLVAGGRIGGRLLLHRAAALAGRRLALAADRDPECRDRPAVKASGRLEALALLELDQRLLGARAEHAIGVPDVEAPLVQHDLHLPDLVRGESHLVDVRAAVRAYAFRRDPRSWPLDDPTGTVAMIRWPLSTMMMSSFTTK